MKHHKSVSKIKKPVTKKEKKTTSTKKSVANNKRKTRTTMIKKRTLNVSPLSQADGKSSNSIWTDYQDIFDNFQEGIFEVDLAGHYTFLNKAVCRALGCTRKEILGSDGNKYVAINDRKKVFKIFNQIYKTGKPVSQIGYHVTRKNGEERYIEASIHLRKDSSGKPIGFRGIAYDFTERKRTEDAVIRSSKEWQATFDAVSDAICLLDKDQRVLRSNKAMTEMFGLPAKKMIGKHCWEIVHRTKKPAAKCPVMTAHRSLKNEEAELKIQGKWFNILVYPLLDDDQSLTGFVHIVKDVTEHKKAEEALRKSEVRFKNLFQNSPVGIFLLKDRKFADVNPAFCEISGYTPEEIIGQPVIIGYKDEEEYERVGKYIYEEVARNGIGISDARLKRKNGELFDGLVYLSLIDAEDPSLGFQAIVIDISERKKTETILMNSEEKFALAFTHSPTAICITTLEEGRYIDANDSYLSNLGYKSEEIIGRTIFDINLWIDSSESRAFFNELLKTGSATNFELRFQDKHGNIRWGICSASIITISGKPCVLTQIIDITEQKLAEEKIHIEEQRFYGITQNLPGVIYQFYAKDNGEYGTSFLSELMNEFAEIMSISEGVKPDDVFSDFYSRIHEEDKERFLSSIKEAVDTVSRWNFEGRVATKTGKIIWFQGLSIPTRLEDRVIFDGIILNITDRKIAEEAAMKEYNFSHTVLETLPAPFYMFDYEKAHFYRWNKGFSQAIGYSDEELLHMTPFDVVPKSEHDVLMKTFEKVFMEGKVTVEMTVLSKDGSTTPYLLSGNILNYEGKSYVIGMGINIAERKKAEEALRAEEERFRIITEQSSDIIILINREGRIIYENPAVEKILGYNFQNRKDQNAFENLHPDDLPFFQELFQTIFRGEIPPVKKTEARIRHANGTWRIFEVVGGPLRINNVIEMLIANLRDITERKEAEEKLYLSELRYRTILEDIQEGYFEIDLAGNFTFFNDTVIRVFGYSREELTGMNYRQFTDEDELNHLSQLYNRVLTTGEPNKELVFKIRRKDGTFRYIEGSISLLKNSSGKPIGFRGIAHDITERILVEQSLRESEEKFRILTESTPTAVMLYQNNKWIYANPAATEISGYSNEELLKLNFWDFVHPDDKQTTMERGRKRQQGEHVTSRYTLRIIAKDGTVKWIDLSGATINIGGSPAGIISVMDITENKRAEEALLERDDRFKKLSAHVPGMIYQFVRRPDGTYCLPFVTESIKTMLGCSPEDVRDDFSPIVKFIYKDDLEKLFASIEESAKNMTLWTLECRVQIPGEPIKWVFGHASPEKLPDGSIVWHGYITDITERKKAEDELKRSEHSLNESQDQAHMGSWEFDSVQQKSFWSAEMFRMLGRDPALGPMSFDDFLALVHPDDRKSVRRDVIKCFNTKAPFHHEYRIVFPDKRMIFIEARGKSTSDLQGNLTRISGVIQNITERKKTEEEIIKLNETLEQRVKERTAELEAFSYSVSHDLRAPLRAVHGFGQALLEDYHDQLDENARDYLGRIRRATENMGELIEDLLKLSRIARSEMDIVQVNLSQIVMSIAEEFQKSQPERSVHFIIEENLEDSADPRLMRILFENLIGNAWKFTGKIDHPEIEFGSTFEDGKKTYFIRDNGTGFDMHYAKKLFTPFQRLHTSEEYSGTGIGLAIVKRIIARHGGTIRAESTVGKGTSILFTLQD